jgi:hypothetical protein
MTDAVKAIIQKIEDGFVFSEQGRWIYMAEQRIYERRVIDQVVNGNVLVDGKWVSIGEARRRGKAAKAAFVAPAKKPPAPVAPAAAPVAAPHADAAATFEAMGDMLETVCIDMAPAMAMAQAQAAAAQTSGAAPQPACVDSVSLLFNPTKNAAADQSRNAMEYIKRMKK